MHITLLQSKLHWENSEANLKMFSEKLNLLEEKTDLIVLPEMFCSGFTMNAATNSETMDGRSVQWMKEIAKMKGCSITGSLIISENNRFYNRLIWINDDGSVYHYDKRHLFTLASEEKTYTAGDKRLIIEWKGRKIFPLICYDLRFPVWSRRTKDFDYDLLIYVANWPERRSYAWKQLLIARAIENQCYVIGLNRVGNDGNDIYHSGDSCVMDYKGTSLLNFESGEESVKMMSLDFKEQDEFRKQFPFGPDGDTFKISF